MPKPSKTPFYLSGKFIGILAGGIALILAALYFAGAFIGISGRNIDITILAPDRLEGGEKMVWEVLVRNRNARALQNVELNFMYPPGAKPFAAEGKSLREKKELGKIGSEEIVKASFEAILFGYEGEDKEARVELEYQPENSSAILAEERRFTTRIVRSPIGVSLEMPQELQPGQEFEIKINYTSNARGSLDNVLIRLEQLDGFSYKSSSLPPEDGAGTLWRVGKLNPGDRGTVTVRGTLTARDQEQRSFNASVVVSEGEDFRVYGGSSYTVTLRRPFLEVALSSGAARERAAARPGEAVAAEVKFKNNFSAPLQNVSVEVRITGTGIDERKIRAAGGDFRGASKSLVWNASSQAVLQELTPGEEGVFSFELAFLNPPPLRASTDKNFSAKLEARIFPEHIPAGLGGQDVLGESTLEIKLASDIQLARRVLYYSAVLPNSGPLPPKVGEETTFAVVWSLTNSTNDVSGLVLKAALPPYMTWKNAVFPNRAKVSFNKSTGEVTWEVGQLKAGTGFVRQAEEAAFQVGLVAGADLVGNGPELVGEVTASGTDTFTKTPVTAKAGDITLYFLDDDKLEANQKRVVP